MIIPKEGKTDKDKAGRDDSFAKSGDSKIRLRQRAEKQLSAAAPANLEMLSSKEIEQLVHELRVHQLELEMQNEELQCTQEALEALRAKYFDLFDLAPVGYITLTERGLIQEANLTVATMLGLPRGSLCSKPLTRFILPEDQDVYYLHRKKLFETGESQVCELRMVSKDGTRPWIRLEATMAKDSDTGATVCWAILSNVTERHTLEATVAQADRLASMGLLAAGIAHEINNPLTYVLYNLERLAKDIPRLAESIGRCPEALRDQIGSQTLTGIVANGSRTIEPIEIDDLIQRAASAVEGAHRIKKIARGLNFFSHVDQTELTMVDLNQAAQHALNIASNETRYRATVFKDLGRVPPILASEGKLAQVLLNLIVNAAHSIDEGDVENNRIKIRTWAEGGNVFVEVVDTGRGIPAENLERIFDPLFTTKAPDRGTGLGLAISRRIVTELGGEILVESKLGMGSRFVVRLPIRQAKPKPPQTIATEPPAVHGRILIVDDEEMIRDVLKIMLAAHETVLAASGEEGQAVLEEDQEFDLILCDLIMPRMTGMDLHAWLAKKNPSLAKRTVFITGGAFTPRASEYLARAGNLMIQKPFDDKSVQRIASEMILLAKMAKMAPDTR